LIWARTGVTGGVRFSRFGVLEGQAEVAGVQLGANRFLEVKGNAVGAPRDLTPAERATFRRDAQAPKSAETTHKPAAGGTASKNQLAVAVELATLLAPKRKEVTPTAERKKVTPTAPAADTSLRKASSAATTPTMLTRTTTLTRTTLLPTVVRTPRVTHAPILSTTGRTISTLPRRPSPSLRASRPPSR